MGDGKYQALGDGDLTPEQLDGMELWDRDGMLAERHRAVGAFLVRRAVAEIRRRRAEEAVSAEHVRKVVRAEAYSVIHRGTMQAFDISQLADAIADRVVYWLTPVFLSGSERVRQVVMSVAATEVAIPIASDIASRVASQLAVIEPNDQERSQLTDLRREGVIDDYPAATQYIDRLLGAKP